MIWVPSRKKPLRGGGDSREWESLPRGRGKERRDISRALHGSGRGTGLRVRDGRGREAVREKRQARGPVSLLNIVTPRRALHSHPGCLRLLQTAAPPSPSEEAQATANTQQSAARPHSRALHRRTRAFLLHWFPFFLKKYLHHIHQPPL